VRRILGGYNVFSKEKRVYEAAIFTIYTSAFDTKAIQA